MLSESHLGAPSEIGRCHGVAERLRQEPGKPRPIGTGAAELRRGSGPILGKIQWGPSAAEFALESRFVRAVCRSTLSPRVSAASPLGVVGMSSVAEKVEAALRLWSAI